MVINRPELNHLSEEELLFLPLLESFEDPHPVYLEIASTKAKMKIERLKKSMAEKAYGPRKG